MDDDQKVAQLVLVLEEERKGISESLYELRKERKDLFLDAIKRQRSFILKIGELSFIFGGAVIPLLKEFADTPTGPYLFVAIGIFILNGLVSLWRSKSLLEADSNDIAGMGMESEAEAEIYKHKIQKLIHDPTNTTYQQDYLAARDSIINHLSTPQKTDEHISFLLDGFVAAFVIGSTLLARVIWPFSQNLFLIVLAFIIVCIIFLMLVSYFSAKERRTKLEIKKERLNIVNKERASWDKEMIERAKSMDKERGR